MDVWQITIAALRRWYVLLPLLTLTAVAVLAASDRSAPEYEARSSAMLAPASVPPEIQNPYSNIAGAQEAMGIVLNSAEVRRELAGEGLVASYEVSAAPRSSIFHIITRSEDRMLAEATAEAVLGLAADELESRQEAAGLSAREQFTLEVLEEPAVIAVVEDSQLRTQAVVGVLGVGLAVLIAVLFDDIIGLFRRTRARRRRRRAADTMHDERDEHPGQLTLDDIPVVDAPPPTLTPNGRPEPHRLATSAQNGGRPRRPVGRVRSGVDQRSHSSLIAEVYASKTSTPASSTDNDTTASDPADSTRAEEQDLPEKGPKKPERQSAAHGDEETFQSEAGHRR